MPVGPGHYDDLCTQAREQADAVATLLIIIEGNRGNGFSCQAPVEWTARLPAILRRVANDIEEALPKPLSRN
jgi:hypothetical protein